MLRETILNILYNIWPMVIIVSVILISLRLTYLFIHKEKFIFYKETFMLGLVIYVLCLFHVVTFQDVSWSTSNFIPFKEMFRYEFNSPMFFRNVVCNMLMFVPFGFFVAYFLKTSKVRYAFILSSIVSCTIEITQLMIGRVFDVDDIFLNVLGGIIGFYMFDMVYEINKHLPKVLKKDYFYNIITLLILVVVILYLVNVIKVGV
jgi:glycopeptide antibiotics resistance protein